MIIVQMIVDIREIVMEILTAVRRILMAIHMVARRIHMEMMAMVARETRMVIAMEVRHKGLTTILMITTVVPISMVVRMVEVIMILASVIKMTEIKILDQKIKAQVISLILIWEVRRKTIIIIEIGNQSQGLDLDQEAVIRQIQEDMEANKILLKIMTISKTRSIGVKREKQLLRQKPKLHVHMRSGAPTKLNKSTKKIFNKIDLKRQTQQTMARGQELDDDRRKDQERAERAAMLAAQNQPVDPCPEGYRMDPMSKVCVPTDDTTTDTAPGTGRVYETMTAPQENYTATSNFTVPTINLPDIFTGK